MENKYIIQSTREALGLLGTTTDFSSEIEMHINSALGILNQNGIGTNGFMVTLESKWSDFKNITQVNGNIFFHMVPLFVFTKIKILFDPPPPSNVEFYEKSTNELLWRLRIAYEEDNNVIETIETV